MDTNNGRIYTPEEMEKLFGGLKSEKRPNNFMEMLLQPTPEQLDRIPPRVEKDEPCPCKSGKKFGECCKEFDEIVMESLKKNVKGEKTTVAVLTNNRENFEKFVKKHGFPNEQYVCVMQCKDVYGREYSRVECLSDWQEINIDDILIIVEYCRVHCKDFVARNERYSS